MSAKVARSWHSLLRRPKAKLQFITIIIGALRVPEPSIALHGVEADVEVVSTMLADFEATWTAMLKSRALPRLVWRGGFELALVRSVPAESHRHALLADLGADMTSLSADERYVIVHVHAVVDLGESDADRLRACLHERWPGRWQTNVKSLYASQTVAEALSALSSYCSKHVLRYNDGGLNDEKVQFLSSYEIIWCRYVNALYGGFDRPWRSKR